MTSSYGQALTLLPWASTQSILSSPGLALASLAQVRSDIAKQASVVAAADHLQMVLPSDEDCCPCLLVEAAIGRGSSPMCPVLEHPARARHGSALRARTNRVCILHN